MFTALANHNYRIYLTGSFVSNIGTWMQRVAQDWLILELSGNSGTAIGFVLALQFGPTLLFSLLHLSGVKAVNGEYETIGEPAVSLDIGVLRPRAARLPCA